MKVMKVFSTLSGTKFWGKMLNPLFIHYIVALTHIESKIMNRMVECKIPPPTNSINEYIEYQGPDLSFLNGLCFLW